jgi:hypothetical protein
VPCIGADAGATVWPATIARIMAGAAPFYRPVQGKTDGGKNDRLGAGAHLGSRRCLRHSISAGPKAPSNQEKTALGQFNALDALAVGRD